MKDKFFEEMNAEEVNQAIEPIMNKAYQDIIDLFEYEDNVEFTNFSLAVNGYRFSIMNKGDGIVTGSYKLYMD